MALLKPEAGESEAEFLTKFVPHAESVEMFADELIRLAVGRGQFWARDHQPSGASGASGGGRRFTASAADGGEACEEAKVIEAFMCDDAMIAKYPGHWHRYDKALENLKTVQREVQAARGCQPWEE